VDPLWVSLDVPDELGEFNGVVPICDAAAAIGRDEHQLVCDQAPQPVPLHCVHRWGNLLGRDVADGPQHLLALPLERHGALSAANVFLARKRAPGW
jgi:hypothetical protein